MTIQMDDAGYGSLLGPTFIGAYRPETGEFVYDAVGLDFFRGPIFQDGAYLREATRVARGLLARLQAPPSEPVQLCTGNIFDDVANGIDHPVQRVKIDGPLQDAIERVQQQYLLGLGVPIYGIAPSAEHFRACLDWVMVDFKARERHVKTGWGKWTSKWRPIVLTRLARRRKAERRLHAGAPSASAEPAE
jgi:hypothetical protein